MLNISPLYHPHGRGNRQCIFQSRPRLTSKLVQKYSPKSVSTVQGHFNQSRKYARSTQLPITMDPSNSEAHCVFTTVMYSIKVYLDQTGCLSVTSSTVVNYLFILYSYDLNKKSRSPEDQNR